MEQNGDLLLWRRGKNIPALQLKGKRGKHIWGDDFRQPWRSEGSRSQESGRGGRPSLPAGYSAISERSLRAPERRAEPLAGSCAVPLLTSDTVTTLGASCKLSRYFFNPQINVRFLPNKRGTRSDQRKEKEKKKQTGYICVFARVPVAGCQRWTSPQINIFQKRWIDK